MTFTRVVVLLAVTAAWWGGPAAAPADAEGCVRRGRRCSTPPAQSGAVKARTERLVAAASRLAADERVVVPVVYHVVYGSFVAPPGEQPDDLEHAPPLALANRQTQALNRAFRGTGFSFRTEEVMLLDFAPWLDDERAPGDLPTDDELTPMVRASTQNREESLHVFLLREAQNLAATPDSRSLYGVPGTDAIILDWDYLPYVEGMSPARDRVLRRFYFEGEMLVHLVGHYLGLLHTFEEWPDGEDVDCRDKCGRTTDLVRDTPAHRWTWEEDEEVGRCIPLDTCKDAPGLDPMTNYMNLEPDLCASEFTPGQVERMERMVRSLRPYLIVPAATDGESPR